MKNPYSPSRSGKIARLPQDLRDQLNRRLQNGEQSDTLLPWLNNLPEVKTLLAAEFNSHPINRQNLSEWRKGGYRDWLVRQEALQFMQNIETDTTVAAQPLNANITDKLARWLALQYAAAARSLHCDNPKSNWNRLREFSSDICRLRRGELHAQHLQIKRDWLSFEQTNATHLREQQFTDWATKRGLTSPTPHPDTDEAMDEVLRALRVM